MEGKGPDCLIYGLKGKINGLVITLVCQNREERAWLSNFHVEMETKGLDYLVYVLKGELEITQQGKLALIVD